MAETPLNEALIDGGCIPFEGEWEKIYEIRFPKSQKFQAAFLKKNSGEAGLREWAEHLGALGVTSYKKKLVVVTRPNECGRFIGHKGDKIAKIVAILGLRGKVTVVRAKIHSGEFVFLDGEEIKIATPTSTNEGFYVFGKEVFGKTSQFDFKVISNLSVEEFKFLDEGPREGPDWEERFDIFRQMHGLPGFKQVKNSL